MFRALMKGSVKLYAGYGLVMLAGLAQLKILSSSLSPGDLGVYFALQAAVALVGELAKLGFPLVFAHFVPKLQARHEDPRPLAFWALLIHLAGGVLVAGGAGAGALLFSGPFADNLPLAALFFYPMVHYSLVASFVLSSRRPGTYSLLNALGAVAYAGALFVLRHNLSVPGALIAGAGVYISLSVAGWLVVRPVPRGPSFLRDTLSYWKFAVATSALSPVFVYADRLIAAAFLSYEAVAIFGVARKIESVGRNLLGVPLDLLAPEASYSWLTEGKASVLRQLRRFTRLYFLWAVAGLVLIPIAGGPVIRLVSSAHYTSALPFLLVLWMGATLGTLYYPYTTVTRGVGNMKLFFASDLLWTGTYLALALVFTKPLGLVALATAPLVAAGVVLVFARAFVFRYLGEDHRGFWPEGLCFVLAAGFALLGLANPWWSMGAVLSLVLYGAGILRHSGWGWLP